MNRSWLCRKRARRIDSQATCLLRNQVPQGRKTAMRFFKAEQFNLHDSRAIAAGEPETAESVPDLESRDDEVRLICADRGDQLRQRISSSPRTTLSRPYQGSCDSR